MWNAGHAIADASGNLIYRLILDSLADLGIAFQRDATGAEVPAATAVVTEQGLFALCRMLSNANEFVYLD